MKKPVKPIQPEVPELLKKNVTYYYVPLKTLKVTLYRSPTDFEKDLKEKGLRLDSPIDEVQGAFPYLDIRIDDDGFVYSRDCAGDNGVSDFDSETVNIGQICKDNNCSPDEVFIKPISRYRGDYIHGSPGIWVYKEVPNPDYEAQQKEYEKFGVLFKKYQNESFDYDHKMLEYERYKKQRIQELEDADEL